MLRASCQNIIRLIVASRLEDPLLGPIWGILGPIETYQLRTPRKAVGPSAKRLQGAQYLLVHIYIYVYTDYGPVVLQM